VRRIGEVNWRRKACRKSRMLQLFERERAEDLSGERVLERGDDSLCLLDLDSRIMDWMSYVKTPPNLAAKRN
jgi:hypothetical protein